MQRGQREWEGWGETGQGVEKLKHPNKCLSQTDGCIKNGGRGERHLPWTLDRRTKTGGRGPPRTFVSSLLLIFYCNRLQSVDPRFGGEMVAVSHQIKAFCISVTKVSVQTRPERFLLEIKPAGKRCYGDISVIGCRSFLC